MAWQKGLKHAPETIAKIRARCSSPEARAEMSALKLGGGRVPKGKESLYRLAIRKRLPMKEALEFCGAAQ
jgi:hypothetical protein